MRLARIISALYAVLALAGCALPQWRVFKAKIDPKLAEKPAAQIEAERQGAKYIAMVSASPAADPVRQVAEIHQVAVPLSSSLGEPILPIAIKDKDAIIARLQKGIVAEQAKVEKWKAFAQKYAGQSIEGTGVNLAPWGGGAGILLLVAACILVPGFGAFVLFVIRRLRSTVQQMAQGVEEFAIEHPDKASELKEYFSSAMDRATKAIVKREKKYLDRDNLTELLKQKTATS